MDQKVSFLEKVKIGNGNIQTKLRQWPNTSKGYAKTVPNDHGFVPRGGFFIGCP